MSLRSAALGRVRVFVRYLFSGWSLRLNGFVVFFVLFCFLGGRDFQGIKVA